MPIAGLPDTTARAIAPFIMAAPPVITHALQGIAQDVAKHLSVWTSGGTPSDDKPPGQPTKPEDTPDEPPPEGRGPDIPPHPGTGAAQTRNNTTSEATGATLDPATLTIKVTGRTLQNRANSHEQATRDLFDSKGTEPISVKGVGHPDDVFNKTAIEVKIYG